LLSELDARLITSLEDLNARLWAWIEQVYHQTVHSSLDGLTSLKRYQRDLPRIRSLGSQASQLDALLYHRVERFVRKDGTVSYLAHRFKVPYELSGKTVRLVVDPHAQRVLGVENEAGVSLGHATALDVLANVHRTRRKPEPPEVAGVLNNSPDKGPRSGPNMMELAHTQYYAGKQSAVSTNTTREVYIMYLQHFGLRHATLGKEITEPWDDGVLKHWSQRFDWLLQSPGIGLLTGEPGVAKTAALRSLAAGLNPHRYQVLYQAETDFGRFNTYRDLARALGVEPSYRRAQLSRDIKQRVQTQVDSKQLTLLWIIDEAQHLPAEFFGDFPSFLNLAFDSRDLMTVWLVGHSNLTQTLKRALCGTGQSYPGAGATQGGGRAGALCAAGSARTQECGLPTHVDGRVGLEILRQASKSYPARLGAFCVQPCVWPCPKGSIICLMICCSRPLRSCNE
jgi:MSHA biogenesis protein MshM